MDESTGKVPPSARQEMHKLARERIKEISKEFINGFEFLENYPKSITFFGGSHISPRNSYYEDARALASRLVKDLGYTIVTGGSSGIMEAANRGASETSGQSVGLLIQLPHAQVTNKYVNSSFTLHHFFIRKVCLTFSAEAFIFYPGGFGTLDEFYEIITLLQTGKITSVPIICVGSEYWNKIKDFMLEELLKRGLVEARDLNLFQIIDNHDDIIEIVKKVPVSVVVPLGERLI